MFKEIIDSSCKLHPVSPEAAEAYASAIGALLENVNAQLESNPKISALIGRNSLGLMHNNHHNHATFMATVFSINSYDLLARTIPWVYRAYHARSFSYDYFPAELVAWQVAITQHIENPAYRNEILAIYQWMMQNHETMIQLSLSGEGLSFSAGSEANEMQQVLLSLLLHGDSQGCLKLADQSIHTDEDLKHFYLNVVWPAMYTIGHLWEKNEITVAEEHLSTAIIGRVMAALYPRFARIDFTRGKAVVSAGPNEFHEMGARMVADFLEMEGWDVTYLGANTPSAEIVTFLRNHDPFLVALSVATVFNLDAARQVIEMIKEDEKTRDIKVMVGGLAFSSMPHLWQNFGADGYADAADGAARTANEWWQARDQ